MAAASPPGIRVISRAWGVLLLFSLFVVMSSGCTDEGAKKVAQKPQPVPAAIVKKLRRGVNLSNWFTFRDTAARWGSHIPQLSDFPVVREAGFEHVRVGFDPLWLADMNQPHELRIKEIATLEQALFDVRRVGLLPILVSQPNAAVKKQLLVSETFRENYLQLWETLAMRFVDWPADQIILEPHNEPEIDDSAVWAEIQKALLTRIREVLPEHTLIATGHGFANVDEMIQMQPLDIDNIAYSFHFYSPHNFTHQGARWGWSMWKRFHSWPYPSSPEAVAEPLKRQDEDAKEHLEWYGEQRWNREKLAEILDKAEAWARQHDVYVICTEYGAYRFNVSDEYRHVWLRDARELMEQRGFGWTIWDYAGGFGVMEGPPGKRYMQEGTRQALGLPKLNRQ